MKKINLEKKLLSIKTRNTNENYIIEEVYEILHKNEESRNKIAKSLTEKGNHSSGNNFIFDSLETDKIVHISHIKKLCVDYRLRFLESNLFKNEIPEEAISKIGRAHV